MIDPAAGVGRQGQVVAYLAMFRIVGTCPIEHRQSLGVYRPSLGPLTVEPQKIALALESLAQAEVIFSGGRRGIGQGLLGLECLDVKWFCMALVFVVTDQEVS
jgi:hypothetical protein